MPADALATLGAREPGGFRSWGISRNGIDLQIRDIPFPALEEFILASFIIFMHSNRICRCYGFRHYLENAWKEWLQIRLDDIYGPSNWILFWCCSDFFLILVEFLVKWGTFGSSKHYLDENTWKEWLHILHAGESWAHSEWIKFWTSTINISNLGTISIWWNKADLVFLTMI